MRTFTSGGGQLAHEEASDVIQLYKGLYAHANSLSTSRMCKNAKKGEKTFAAACDEYVEYSDACRGSDHDDEPELSDDE